MTAMTMTAQDTATMLGRELRHTLRYPLMLIASVMA